MAMASKLLISVLTPTMGRANSFLVDCVASVQAQILPLGWEVEHILALNGNFNEEEILQKISKENKNVKVVYSYKNGVSAARNIAFLESQGEVLLDLDDDDILPSSSIIDRVNHLLESNKAWSIGNLLKIDEDRKYKIGEELIVKELPEDKNTMLQGFLEGKYYAWTGTRTYYRKALEVAGPWDESFTVAEDLEHWLRLTATAGAPDHCDKYLALFREKNNSLGIDAVRSGLMKESRDRAVERWIRFPSDNILPEGLPSWH